MIELTLAGGVVDGEKCLVDETCIMHIGPNHSTINRSTLIVMSDGSGYSFSVQESVEQIQQLIAK